MKTHNELFSSVSAHLPNLWRFECAFVYHTFKTKEGVSGLVDLVNDNFFTNSTGSGSNLEAKNF